MVRLVTGGTGFIGRHLLLRLARREGTTFVLVRSGSRERADTLIGSMNAGSRVKVIEGDITLHGLGVKAADRARLRGADLYHLAAVYDLEAPEEENERSNGEGTRNVVDFARSIESRIHHVSSIAVAGSRWKGKFTE